MARYAHFLFDQEDIEIAEPGREESGVVGVKFSSYHLLCRPKEFSELIKLERVQQYTTTIYTTQCRAGHRTWTMTCNKEEMGKIRKIRENG